MKTLVDPDSSAPGARPPRLVEIALALSLVLNVFVVGGFVYSQLAGPSGAPVGHDRRLDLMANRLGVDTEKSKPFREFKAGLRQVFNNLNQTNKPLFDQLWQEALKPEPDLAHLDQLVDEIIKNRQAVSHESLHMLVKFSAALSPDQRALLLTLIENRKEMIAGPLRNAVGN